MREGTYIRFEENGVHQKRVSWNVITKGERLGALLGEVSWFSSWKKYVFVPNKDLSLLLEEITLIEIAMFCMNKTREQQELVRFKRAHGW